MPHPLITAWREHRPQQGRHLLSGDEALLKFREGKCIAPLVQSWREAYSARDFAEPNDGKKFQLHLVPIPFIGNIERASVILLLLNPGYDPHDTFAEFEIPDFTKRALRNLQQDLSDEEHPFHFLDPAFAWHAGFRWWHGKLSETIKELGQRRHENSFRDARRFLSQHLAAIELVPYHSKKYPLTRQVENELLSTTLARNFVAQRLLERAERGEATIIVLKGAPGWGLRESRNVIVYRGAEAVAALLNPPSKGGAAILRHLSRMQNR